MNLTDLIAKRQQGFESKLANLTFEYYRLKKRLGEVGKMIIATHMAISEGEQSKRDYVT